MLKKAPFFGGNFGKRTLQCLPEEMTWWFSGKHDMVYTYILYYIYTHTFTGRVCLDFVSMSATDYTIQQGGPPIGKFFNHAVC